MWTLQIMWKNEWRWNWTRTQTWLILADNVEIRDEFNQNHEAAGSYDRDCIEKIRFVWVKMNLNMDMNMNMNMNMKYSREHEYEHEHEHKMFLQNMWKWVNMEFNLITNLNKNYSCSQCGNLRIRNWIRFITWMWKHRKSGLGMDWQKSVCLSEN